MKTRWKRLLATALLLQGMFALAAAADSYIAYSLKEAEKQHRKAGRSNAELMEIGGIDVAQVDLSRVGLTQAMTIAMLAQSSGIPVVNHNFTTDINVAASLHFLASVPNAFVMEYCVEPSELSRSLARNPIEIVDGHARVPQEPGLGVEPDPAVIERYLVRS